MYDAQCMYDKRSQRRNPGHGSPVTRRVLTTNRMFKETRRPPGSNMKKKAPRITVGGTAREALKDVTNIITPEHTLEHAQSEVDMAVPSMIKIDTTGGAQSACQNVNGDENESIFTRYPEDLSMIMPEPMPRGQHLPYILFPPNLPKTAKPKPEPKPMPMPQPKVEIPPEMFQKKPVKRVRFGGKTIHYFDAVQEKQCEEEYMRWRPAGAPGLKASRTAA